VLSWAGAWGSALRDGVSRPFQDATGVVVEAVRHVGLQLPEALTHACESNSEPPVDVVWSNTSPALRAAQHDWCESLDGAAILSELAERGRLSQPDGWPIAQMYVVHYVLAYRRALYPIHPPVSWNVLERTEHTGRVVFYPGGNGFYPVAQVLGGGQASDLPHNMTACWSTIQRLRGQLGAPDYSIGLHAPIRRGEIDLCYRALPNVLAFRADGLDVDWTTPCEGIADTTDAMWIPRGLTPDVLSCARSYIWFALSAPVQARWCELLGALPMNRNARARNAVFERAGMPSDPDDVNDILYVPEHVKAACEPAWERRFESICRDSKSAS
jgi:putative spermidine/putrescine transport system substrate-binding protein